MQTTAVMRAASRAAMTLCLGASLLGAMPAHALFDDDEARRAILDLRQRHDALQASHQKLSEEVRRANEENAQMRRSLLDLQSQIDGLRADSAKSRGQGEQLARDVADVQKRQKEIAQGVDDRLRKFEPGKVTVDGREFLADPAETRDYDAALAIFRKGDFAAAQTAFSGFIKRYPQSGYNASSLFWLGNAQYATRDYKEAINNFRSMLTVNADHPRAPEAALSIANCQLELKEVRGARKTLEDLIKVYPQSEAALAAKDRLSKMR
ncbi:tol-pal system protein YbgF [Pseudorhodoferax sp. Leaf267]|uniref:tol-pal system protein YbgF n=1 Tax=Pseudorhodoferax sp. Leaf267 TaxID=1736316 RepID=UPI0006F9A7E6|nr:tol-pal system protein YbgF [Pseudorhodoferax sp. Leaf267]KQP14752.1 tol-pal system protein [Pseudorhodoferax sp. Leaf267]